jgi:hypothetical protein
LLWLWEWVTYSSGGSSEGTSSNGGGTSTTPTANQIVGTWNRVSLTGGRWVIQTTFNSNGTGQDSFGTFTWTQTGNQITNIYAGGIAIPYTSVISSDGNTLTVSREGTTAVYKRE